MHKKLTPLFKIRKFQNAYLFFVVVGSPRTDSTPNSLPPSQMTLPVLYSPNFASHSLRSMLMAMKATLHQQSIESISVFTLRWTFPRATATLSDAIVSFIVWGFPSPRESSVVMIYCYCLSIYCCWLCVRVCGSRADGQNHARTHAFKCTKCWRENKLVRHGSAAAWFASQCSMAITHRRLTAAGDNSSYVMSWALLFLLL